jgi:hypothetical protein
MTLFSFHSRDKLMYQSTRYPRTGTGKLGTDRIQEISDWVRILLLKKPDPDPTPDKNSEPDPDPAL